MGERSARHGLTLSVYRNARGGDTSRNGISNQSDQVTLVGTYDSTTENSHRVRVKVVTPMPDHARVFEVSPSRPAVALVLRRIGDKLVHLEPAIWDEERGAFVLEPRWTMFGGNYADSGDSRGSDLVKGLLGHSHYGALAIHDRIED